MTPTPVDHRRVLLIEDEAVLRANLVRGLGKLEGVAVIGVGTMEEAVASLEQAAPDLVISDIDLPDRLGLEIIGELHRRGWAPPILFVSAYLKAYQAQIPPHAGVDVLEKPISIDQLRLVVQEKLSLGPSPHHPFGVAEYLQLAGLGRHSVVVEVQCRDLRGHIIVLGGEPWSAEDGQGHGEAAFWRLAMARGCQVGCTTLKGEPGSRNLTGTMESLLLEAACRTDESQASQAAPPQGASKPEAEFNALVDHAIGLSLEKRYAEALESFQCALLLRPDDRRVEANIRRLTELLQPPPA